MDRAYPSWQTEEALLQETTLIVSCVCTGFRVEEKMICLSVAIAEEATVGSILVNEGVLSSVQFPAMDTKYLTKILRLEY